MLKLKAEQAVGRTEGYGCQVDTHLYYNGYSEETYREWLARVDAMKLQSVRTQVFPEWFERELGKYEFDTIEIGNLCRLLDVCEARKIAVDLSFYGCCRIFRSKDGKYRGSVLANAYEGNWITAPRLRNGDGTPFDGYGAYGDAVAALLGWLIRKKGYTCIYEVSLFPEPNCSFFDENGVCSDEAYFAFYRIVCDRVRAAGLSVRFSGPGDCANDPVRYAGFVAGLNGLAEKNTSSVYQFTEASSDAEMTAYARELVRICGRFGNTWGVCECGSHHFIDPANQADIDTYDRALFLGRFFINLTNAGCTNIKYWVLNDVWYDDYVMRLGLWQLMDETFRGAARPQYYVWSLITRLTAFGSEICPMIGGNEAVCATSFRLPDGKRTCFFANRSDDAADIAVEGIEGGVWNVYEVTESVCTGSAEPVAASGQLAAGKEGLVFSLKPRSFVALSEL